MILRTSLEYLDNLPKQMVIAGEKVEAVRGLRFETYDPATGQPIGSVPQADTDDVDRAVAAAKAALAGSWRQVLPAERGRILHKVARLLRRDQEHLASVESLNCGKPLRESLADIETAARYFEYYAGAADKLQGDTIPLGLDLVSFTLPEPVGVTAHIIPWNFPLATTARGVAPALAVGNTIVVKPAEQTPLTSLLLADLLQQAGLPEGVYNVVTGLGHEAGAALTAHPDVNHVTFTGSVGTGQTVMRAAAQHIASVTLELGGKSPIIVLADADLDAAVAGTLKGIYLNSGQVCSASSRLIVERAVHTVMLEQLVKSSGQLTHGHGWDDPDLGPLISPQQLTKVSQYVSQAKARGIEVAIGGTPKQVHGLEGGWFFEPTILDQVPASDFVAQEEIFGPVLAVQVVDSPEEALSVANGTQYGLVAGLYTKDISRALTIARDIDAGQVFINQYFAGGVETPFGGNKLSGFGREKGLAALQNYSRIKCITARLS